MSEANLDFLQNGSPKLDTVLLKIAEGVSNGTIKTHSNEDDQVFMNNMLKVSKELSHLG